MKRTILITALFVASQPLLVSAGVLVRWVIDCGMVPALAPSAPIPLSVRHGMCC